MLTDLGVRLRAVRGHFNLSTAEMAKKMGLKNRKSWEGYENGQNSPKVDVLHHLSREGIDPRWVLTGQGAMLLGQAADAPGLDEDLMARLADGIARVYREANARVSPADLGRLTARFYDDLTAAYDDPGERRIGVAGILARLRRELREPPTSAESDKRSA